MHMKLRKIPLFRELTDYYMVVTSNDYLIRIYIHSGFSYSGVISGFIYAIYATTHINHKQNVAIETETKVILL